jgi:hypothetical protein
LGLKHRQSRQEKQRKEHRKEHPDRHRVRKAMIMVAMASVCVVIVF